MIITGEGLRLFLLVTRHCVMSHDQLVYEAVSEFISHVGFDNLDHVVIGVSVACDVASNKPIACLEFDKVWLTRGLMYCHASVVFCTHQGASPSLYLGDHMVRPFYLLAPGPMPFL